MIFQKQMLGNISSKIIFGAYILSQPHWRHYTERNTCVRECHEFNNMTDQVFPTKILIKPKKVTEVIVGFDVNKLLPTSAKYSNLDDAGRHWETEREAFLHPISRLCMWPYVGGPAWE
ncbi:hypothetical protein TNCV_2493111 [Trichonephila clavipes]|uniref:Uncharacterized protein n=1 Tax=Trichonephila clavipes TaxID=2585209 RepID=A0A8X6RRT7_TRICX|nr:hypothetical protein TNCV_2493111 [Trichonephila clavipes]